MAYEAKAIANEFLKIASQEGAALSPMQIVKLVYFAHGWHLALTNGQPLINELVGAWDYGPVIPSIYHEFKKFGRNAIMEPATSVRVEGTRFFLHTSSLDQQEPDPARLDYVKRLIRRIWEIYGKLNGIQLSKMTHEPNSPWDRIRREGNNASLKNVTIPNQYIQDYFRQHLRRVEPNPVLAT